MNIFDIIIVGGGASGIMAAITAANNNKKVAIIDAHSFVGKKLLSTGNGHCNLTNLNMSSAFFNQNIDKFLNRFNQFQTIEFFENIGLITKADASGRVYPFSFDAKTVLSILSSKLKDLGITIFSNRCVTTINKEKNSFSLTTFSTSQPDALSKNISKNLKTKKDSKQIFPAAASPEIFSCSKLVLASGGSSNFPFSTNFPVQFNPASPSLVALKTVEKTQHLSGIRLSDVSLKSFFFPRTASQPSSQTANENSLVSSNSSFFLNFNPTLQTNAQSLNSNFPNEVLERRNFINQKTLYSNLIRPSIFQPAFKIQPPFNNNNLLKISKEEFGEILFKDNGISGIVALNISTIFARNHSFHGKIFIDMAPKMTEIDLKTLLNARRSLNSNILFGFLNDSIAKEIFNRLNLNFNSLNSQLTEKNISEIAHLIKNFKFIVCGNYEKNQVFSGGVPLFALNENLESKTVQNLHFCGELVDVDGETGGYNLQWAWTSGHIVGGSL